MADSGEPSAPATTSQPQDKPRTLFQAITVHMKSTEMPTPHSVFYAVDAWMVENQVGTDVCAGCPHPERGHVAHKDQFPCSLCSCQNYEWEG
jgi:hypothetical protein